MTNTDKSSLLSDGKLLIELFCTHNAMEKPLVTVVSSSEWMFDVCAYYRHEEGIKLCLEKCAAVGKAGASWSWPGYTIDRTPFGVLAHELGHHVDLASGGDSGDRYFSDYSKQVRKASGEDELTNYCPNDAEWFAEMFRLFVTNPDLLKRVRPRTYAALIEDEFVPVERGNWDFVLRGAPDRTIAQARKKMRQTGIT